MNQKKIICIFHANCADGFTAAWCVRKALGEKGIEFVPAGYGDTPPDVTGADVIIVDFSYKRPVLEEMASTARSILILDHHKTAQAELDGLRSPAVGWDNFQQQLSIELDRGIEPNWPRAAFDMNLSGAQMAWDFFHGSPGTGQRPILVDYVGDRDLWKWEMCYSREVSAVIASHQQSFETWDHLQNRLNSQGADFLAFVEEGAAILRYEAKLVDQIIGTSTRRMNIGGYDVPVANAPYSLASETAGRLAENEPFAATFLDTEDGRTFSLRSRNEGVDVSEIAKTYGGGGHRNAAGFKVQLPPKQSTVKAGDIIWIRNGVPETQVIR